MIFVATCGNCGSADWRICGVSVEAGTLHPVQCRCRSCGLIFANPRATGAELDHFYQRYYSDCCPQYLLTGSDLADRVSGDVGYLLEVVGERRGKFLEVGFGGGVTLAAARDMGFDVYGLELSPAAVSAAKENLGLENTWCATLETRAFPAEEFDVVYAWHVIEHVDDLHTFVGELHRVLKPGGLLFIGTESGTHVANALFRAWRFAGARMPRTTTATEHTFVFSVGSLRDSLERRGFRVERILAYDEVKNRAGKMSGGSFPKCFAYKLVWSVAQVADRLLKTGPYLKCWAVK